LKELSAELSCDLISYDYAGYGKHKFLDDVKPTEQNVYDDAQTVFEYVQQQGLPIIIYGRSLGSAPAVYIASQNQNEIKGLVVESGFRSISRVVSNTLHNIFDMFDNEKLMKQQYIVPTLFIHGKKDTVVPFTHGEYLYEICACEKKYKFWLENGHHNDIESRYKSEVLFRLNTFIDLIVHEPTD